MLGLLPELAKPLRQGSQPSAKPGRQGPKQAERRSALWKSPRKDVVQVGAPARGIFSAHREESSVLQQGTPQPVTAGAVHSHHPAAAMPVAAALVLRSESGPIACGWRQKANRKDGFEQWLLKTRQCRPGGKKATSSTPLSTCIKCTYL